MIVRHKWKKEYGFHCWNKNNVDHSTKEHSLVCDKNKEYYEKDKLTLLVHKDKFTLYLDLILFPIHTHACSWINFEVENIQTWR